MKYVLIKAIRVSSILFFVVALICYTLEQEPLLLIVGIGALTIYGTTYIRTRQSTICINFDYGSWIPFEGHHDEEPHVVNLPIRCMDDDLVTYYNQCGTL